MLTNGPSLPQLKRFLVLASELHFSRAADRLGISQPLLSEQIRELEGALGVQLFLRTSRHVSLTSAGKFLRSRVAFALQELEDSFDTAIEMEQGRSSPLRVGYSDEFARYFLPELVSEVRRSHPTAEFVFQPGCNSELRAALVEASIDLALVCPIFEDPPEVGWEVIEFAPTLLMVGIPPGHRLADAEQLTFEEIATEDFLGSSSARPSEIEAFVDRHFSQKGLARNIILRSSDTDLLKGLAAAHAAILLGPAEDFDWVPGIKPVPVTPTVELSRGAVLRAATQPGVLQTCRKYVLGQQKIRSLAVARSGEVTPSAIDVR